MAEQDTVRLIVGGLLAVASGILVAWWLSRREKRYRRKKANEIIAIIKGKELL